MSNGKGLAACYIASKNILPTDDKLYTADFFSRETRLTEDFFIENFGRGTFGTLINPDFPLNNSADVIWHCGNKFLLDNLTHSGLVTFDRGMKVFVFADEFLGAASILNFKDDFLTLDRNFTEAKKIVTVAEVQNLTLTKTYAYENLFVLVKSSCTISASVESNCLIVAETLNLAGCTKLGVNLLLAAKNISGFDENVLPRGKTFLLGNFEAD